MTRTRTPGHWPEYLIEAGALGTFMVSAAAFASLFSYRASPVAAAIHDELFRRACMGLAMGMTAAGIVYSPWGQRSGAHMNPVITLTFFRLGKVQGRDVAGYLTAQFAGGMAGITLAWLALPGVVADPAVDYVRTVPGPAGSAVAAMAEVAISFGMMLAVLIVSNHPRLSRFTGVCAGLLVWTYITLESPLSGMSMNPARTFGSALLAGDFRDLWIYFVAPPVGMFAAAELFVRRVGIHRVLCAKLQHPSEGPCIFGCYEREAHIRQVA